MVVNGKCWNHGKWEVGYIYIYVDYLIPNALSGGMGCCDRF